MIVAGSICSISPLFLALWRTLQMIIRCCWIIGNFSNGVAACFHSYSLSVIAQIDDTVQLLVRHAIVLCHVYVKSRE